jgi:hypothetical protein
VRFRYLPPSGMVFAFSKYIKVPLAKIVAARYRPAKETEYIFLLIWNTLI